MTHVEAQRWFLITPINFTVHVNALDVISTTVALPLISGEPQTQLKKKKKESSMCLNLECSKNTLFLPPAEVCLNFSLFFFLHFQGLKSRPSVANLLLRRIGGVCVPETSDSERMAASRSTSSAGEEKENRK